MTDDRWQMTLDTRLDIILNSVDQKPKVIHWSNVWTLLISLWIKLTGMIPISLEAQESLCWGRFSAEMFSTRSFFEQVLDCLFPEIVSSDLSYHCTRDRKRTKYKYQNNKYSNHHLLITFHTPLHDSLRKTWMFPRPSRLRSLSHVAAPATLNCRPLSRSLPSRGSDSSPGLASSYSPASHSSHSAHFPYLK